VIVGRRLAPVALMTLAVVTGACARDDGRALRPPAPGATVPTTSTTVVAPTQIGPPTGESDPSVSPSIVLNSVAFAPGARIPERYTCDGDGSSPLLDWSGVPEGTVELALTVVDTDADGFVHWVLAGLDPTVTAISDESVPEGAVEAANDAGGESGWFGPCPPEDGSVHHYVFTLYALQEPSGVEPGMSGAEAIDRITSAESVAGTLTGTYSR
jgi:Raf kinase inhibitor-like YbhB/YbcL family protein